MGCHLPLQGRKYIPPPFSLSEVEGHARPSTHARPSSRRDVTRPLQLAPADDPPADRRGDGADNDPVHDLAIDQPLRDQQMRRITRAVAIEAIGQPAAQYVD